MNIVMNQQYLRVFNRYMVFGEIYKNRIMSRGDLQKKTGLTPTAISNIVNDLLEKRLIVEGENGKSTGGRRPKLLEVNVDDWSILGIDLDPARLSIGLMDLKGSLIDLRTKDLKGNDIEYLVEEIKTIVDSIKKDVDRKILAAGVGIPGWVCPETNIVTFAPNLGWKGVDIRTRLTEELKLPIYVDNEASVTALGESWAGSAQNIRNFIAVNFRTGVGSGIVIDSRIYKGVTGSSGEIGHIPVDEDGSICSCGNYGCLETIASTPSICRRLYSLLKKGMPSVIKDTFTGKLEDINISMIAEAARSGDALSIEVLNQVGRYIGLALSIAINLLNPDVIVLGADAVEYEDIILSNVRETIRSKALFTPVKRCKVVISSLGRAAPIVGAGILGLQSHLTTMV
mgnify:CR=1 FL=1